MTAEPGWITYRPNSNTGSNSWTVTGGQPITVTLTRGTTTVQAIPTPTRSDVEMTVEADVAATADVDTDRQEFVFDLPSRRKADFTVGDNVVVWKDDTDAELPLNREATVNAHHYRGRSDLIYTDDGSAGRAIVGHMIDRVEFDEAFLAWKESRALRYNFIASTGRTTTSGFPFGSRVVIGSAEDGWRPLLGLEATFGLESGRTCHVAFDRPITVAGNAPTRDTDADGTLIEPARAHTHHLYTNMVWTRDEYMAALEASLTLTDGVAGFVYPEYAAGERLPRFADGDRVVAHRINNQNADLPRRGTVFSTDGGVFIQIDFDEQWNARSGEEPRMNHNNERRVWSVYVREGKIVPEAVYDAAVAAHMVAQTAPPFTFNLDVRSTDRFEIGNRVVALSVPGVPAAINAPGEIVDAPLWLTGFLVRFDQAFFHPNGYTGAAFGWDAQTWHVPRQSLVMEDEFNTARDAVVPTVGPFDLAGRVKTTFMQGDRVVAVQVAMVSAANGGHGRVTSGGGGRGNIRVLFDEPHVGDDGNGSQVQPGSWLVRASQLVDEDEWNRWHAATGAVAAIITDPRRFAGTRTKATYEDGDRVIVTALINTHQNHPGPTVPLEGLRGGVRGYIGRYDYGPDAMRPATNVQAVRVRFDEELHDQNGHTASAHGDHARTWYALPENVLLEADYDSWLTSQQAAVAVGIGADPAAMQAAINAAVAKRVAEVQAVHAAAMSRYKARVRQVARTQGRNEGWCEGGMAEAFRLLDLDPLQVNKQVRIVADLTIGVHGSHTLDEQTILNLLGLGELKSKVAKIKVRGRIGDGAQTFEINRKDGDIQITVQEIPR